ncbi:MAG: radical SAM protein [Candidatus Aenigmarchaeota archaeon]|nr:radical SAM protein [Candidatus Aenigmarchaeota archaeon]
MKIVATADESCMHNYNLSFMAGFLSCVPRDNIPATIQKYIEKKFFSEVPNNDGVAEIAILALRKIEACLKSYGIDVAVAVPQHAEKIEADAYFISTMDPFGVGPATTTMVGLAGGGNPFNKFFFQRLVTKIRKGRPNAKIIVGGPGAWEFDIFTEEQKKLGIDCVFNGAVESAPREFWNSIENGVLPKQFKSPASAVRPDPMLIRGPSFWGMVEISRGCGRGCQFCDFELMSGFKWLPKEEIVKEAELNAASPLVDNITLLSEDTIRYGTPQGHWKPTGDIVGLVKELTKFGKPLGFTHCCLATALAAPKVMEDFSYHAGLNENHMSGFQTGIESGSPRIVERYLKGKLLPWKPEDWPEVVQQGMAIMVDNYVIPHGTLVMGLPEERPEDTIKTIELVDDLSHIPSLILPLFFVPLSIIKDRFFLSDMMNAEQKELLMAASRHTAKWARRLPNWSGSLGFGDRIVFTTGANYSFNFLEAMRHGKPNKKDIAAMMLKSMTSAVWSQFTSTQNLEYFRETQRSYPVVEKIGNRHESGLKVLQ